MKSTVYAAAQVTPGDPSLPVKPESISGSLGPSLDLGPPGCHKLTSSGLPWPRVLLGTASPGLSSVTISLFFPSITPYPELSSELLPLPKPPLQPPSLSSRPFAPAAPRYPDTGSGTHRRSGLAGVPGSSGPPLGAQVGADTEGLQGWPKKGLGQNVSLPWVSQVIQSLPADAGDV